MVRPGAGRPSCAARIPIASSSSAVDTSSGSAAAITAACAAVGSVSGGTTSSTSVPNFLPLTVSVFGEVLLGSRITLWPRNSIRNDAEAQLFSS